MQQIYQATGFNPVVDGSSQDKDTAVGVEKIRANSFNVAIKPLALAHTRIIEDTFTHVAELEKDRVLADEDYAEYVIEKIGKERVDYQKLVGQVKYSDIAIFIRFRPTEEDLLSLSGDLMRAVEVGQITIANSIRCKEIAKVSIKAAQGYLEDAIEMKLAKDRETSQMQQQQNAQVQIQSSQAKMQSELAIIKAKLQADLQLQREKYKFEMELAGVEGVEDRMTEVTKGEVKKELLEEIEGGETQKTDPEKTVNPSGTRSKGVGNIVQSPRITPRPSDDVQKSI
jgi:hypothetical protein